MRLGRKIITLTAAFAVSGTLAMGSASAAPAWSSAPTAAVPRVSSTATARPAARPVGVEAAGYRKYVGKKSKWCLTDVGGSGSRVEARKCGGSKRQLWVRWGTSSLKNKATGRCLTSGWRAASNRVVISKKCAANQYQRWNIVKTVGAIKIIDKKYYMCLASDANTNAFLTSCNGSLKKYIYWKK